MGFYKLEKKIWTDQDFDIMGWHDCRLWALLGIIESFEFVLDLDYIFKWEDPSPGETNFKFWVSPVTMVFENAHDVKIDIESQQGLIQIDNLFKSEERKLGKSDLFDYLYQFICQEGDVTFRSTGYKMYVRQPPQLIQRQYLALNIRGGISVERST